MVSRPTRTLLDIALLVGVAWMWVAIYQSVTRSGLWSVLAHAVGGATTLPSELAVLAVCVLAGWLSLAGLCWLAWRVLERGVGRDFPVARLRR